jgi:hypothetical protein
MPARHPADVVDRLLKLGAQMHVPVSERERMDIAHTCSTAAKEIRNLRRRIEDLQARLDASPTRGERASTAGNAEAVAVSDQRKAGGLISVRLAGLPD